VKFLPFKEGFREAVMTGRKTATARTRRFGDVGDVVATPFGPVRLVGVYRLTLDSVRNVYWQEEGAGSPEDFTAIWNAIHPRKGFDPAQRVWLHRFKLAQSGESPRKEGK
jgi:hypothetical protein